MTLNVNMESQKMLQEVIELFKENPDEFYSPQRVFEITQKRDTKYFGNALWRLWKQGILTHNDRRYYRWNKNQIEI
jgi:hypothetical protein